MPQFYTLEEAARLLGTTQDELKKMAERNEIRAFRDRGTMRFRGPEIDELARRRGGGSDPDLQLGERSAAKPASPTPKKAGPTSPTPKKGGPASPTPKKGGPPSPTPKKGDEKEVFDFSLSPDDSDQVEIGQELHLEGSSAGGKSGPRSGSGRKQGGAKSPPPKAGSDSDVRLVPDGSDVDFQTTGESDVKKGDAPAPKPASTPPKRKAGPSSKSRLDSGPQVVPLEAKSDSDVKVVDSDAKVVEPVADAGRASGQPPPKAPSDSDIRLEPAPARSPAKPGPGKKGPDEAMLTDEIDLDAELKKAESAARSKKPKPKSKAKPAQPQLPTTSPFELSEADLDMSPPKPVPAAPSTEDSSSDFELTPASQQEPSPLELSSSEEIPLQASSSDDEVTLGELTGSGDKSGINLKDPADSGISLEQTGSSDEVEFELSLEPGSTPKPAAAAPEVDSDSEFELSLDADSSAETPAAKTEDSDSEFELSLDAASDLEPGSSPVESDSSPVDSDSEFELSLDDSGGLALEEGAEEGSSGEKDIFETDFEVPALDEESGSQAVALEDSDTDLESSDFDLALDEGDAAAEEESGSQVVALEDEEEADESAETVARPRRQRGAPVLAEDSDEVEDLFTGEEGEEGAPQRGAAAAAVAAPAEWGPLPAIVLLPCLVIMLLGTFMSYELVRRDGTNNPNMITKAIAPILGYDLSKE
jgi:excisionase family DNA binding protein